MNRLTIDFEPDSELSTLGQRLRQARLKKRLSQNELADILSFGKQAISGWEHDRTEPNLKTLKLLAFHLEIPLIELLGD